MQKFKFKDFKTGKIIRCSIPTTWEEITLKQLVRIKTEWEQENRNLVDLLSILADKDLSMLENTKSNLWDPLIKSMSFIFNPAPDWNNLKRPKYIYLNGKKVKAPVKLELERFGQKVMAVNVVKEEKELRLRHMPDLIAIYLQPYYNDDNKFDRQQLDEVKLAILNSPAILVYPLAGFFLSSWWRLKILGKLGLIPYLLTQKLKFWQKQQELKDYMPLET